MIHFIDRKDAGKQLATGLKQYTRRKDVVLLALPRGGVAVAEPIAQALHLPLDIIITKKLGAPFSPELAVGALMQDGEALWNEELLASLGLTKRDMEPIVESARHEMDRRVKLYQHNQILDLHDKVAIIIDDGIATGATIKAAVASIKKKGVRKIVIAAPVAPLSVVESLKPLVDEVIYLEAPRSLLSIGQFYDEFHQLTDEEVLLLLQKTPSAKNDFLSDH